MAAGERRLVAIVAADVAGYSRLMGADEEGTIAALRGHRAEVVDPALADFNGRIANTAGDSLLIEFPSAVDALRCAMRIQEEIAARNTDVPEDRQLIFRMGINVGDVVANGDDLLGDGVNVAARIESVAPVGGICLSRTARDQVRDRLDVALEDLGEIEVKNIARPVRVFRVLADGEVATPPPPSKPGTRAGGAARRAPLALIAAIFVLVILAGGGAYWWTHHSDTPATENPAAGKHSIAVLPFANLSGDTEQAYFANGITEDITTDLSRVAGLYVTSQAATLRYRGKRADPKTVGAELEVGHVLEGTVRRAGDKIRVTATLIDAKTGGQLWAERFDRSTEDIFAIQDEIAGRVVTHLSATLTGTSLARAERGYTPKVEAYDLYIRGRAKRIPPSPPNLKAALDLFNATIDIDPKFAGGYAGASFVHSLLHSSGRSNASVDHLQIAVGLALKAVELDPDFGPGWGSLAEAFFRGQQYENALDAIQKAMTAAPSDSLMRANYGRYLGFVGRPEEGIAQVKEALRMSPDSLPLLYFLGANYRAAGQFDAAIEALREHRKRLGGRIAGAPTAQLIAAYTQAGRDDDARAEVAVLKKALPKYTFRVVGLSQTYKNPADQKLFTDALIKAGLNR